MSILDHQQITELGTALRGLPMNWNGHHKAGREWLEGGWWTKLEKREKELWGDFRSYNTLMDPKEAREIMAAITSGVPLDRYVDLFWVRRYGCQNCPEGDDLHLETNGAEVRAVGVCPNPGGLMNHGTLQVPSGKIICTDDLRCPAPIANEQDINRRWGQWEMFRDYAAAGQMHGQVGNCSPRVYRCPDGVYVVGNYDDDTDPDGDGPEPGEAPRLPPGKRVASICTDLWAYSFMDYDEARRRARAFKVNWRELRAGCDVIKVPPGGYAWEHYYPEDRDGRNVTIAKFWRAGDARVQPDWLDSWLRFDVTAGQILSAKWPTLYPTTDPDWVGCCQRVMDATFRGCVPDRDWNPNGFKNDFTIEEARNTPDREVPRFTSQHWWWDIDGAIQVAATGVCEHFGGQILLNPSHAQVAAYILESTIRYGMKARTHHPTVKPGDAPPPVTYDTDGVRRNMRLAATLWPQLIARYPAVTLKMQDFSDWMQDPAVVDKWITDFPEAAFLPDPPTPEELERRAAEEAARIRRNEELWIIRNAKTPALVLKGGVLRPCHVSGRNDPEAQRTPEDLTHMHHVKWDDGFEGSVYIRDVRLTPESKLACEAYWKAVTDKMLADLRAQLKEKLKEDA